MLGRTASEEGVQDLSSLKLAAAATTRKRVARKKLYVSNTTHSVDQRPSDSENTKEIMFKS